MNRTKKRNNYTLSTEAQEIVDKVPAYKKSGFVSEAIKEKADLLNDYKEIAKIYNVPDGHATGVTFEHENEAANKLLSKLKEGVPANLVITDADKPKVDFNYTVSFNMQMSKETLDRANKKLNNGIERIDYPDGSFALKKP